MRNFLNLLVVCMFAMTALTAHAAEKRVALVIGNSAYPSSRLDNPKNDATAIAATFRQLGFGVDLVIDATKADFNAALKRYAAKADKADAAVLFYAGHGMQANNHNYLVPIDAKPQNERDLKREMIRLDDIIDDMGAARVKLVFFDACRDNPLARSFSRGGSRGMAAPVETSGTLISFATKHGNTAADGESKHSPYTEALLAALEKPNEEVHALLRKKVQEAVKKKTGGQQEPWAYGSLNGDFYLIQGPVNVTVQQQAVPRLKSDAEIEQELWDSIKDTREIVVFEEYLKQYPKGRYAGQARITLTRLKAEARNGSAQASPPGSSGKEDAETALWKVVESGNSQDDYDAYLSQHPKGKYAVLAKSRKQKLEEQAQREALQKEQDAWSTAETGNSEESFSAYLKAHPSGQYVQLAQNRINKLQADAGAKAEQSLWQQTEQSNDKAAITAYLSQHPAGRNAATARLKLAQIEKEEAEMKPGKVFRDCPECPDMVVIPAGSFQMGGDIYDSEKPIHPVIIGKAFALGKTEVTQSQWRVVMGNNPSDFSSCGDDCPVEKVTWNNAQEYVRKLSAITGKTYRLPSEAEWEYACRAGGNHTYCGGDDLDALAWPVSVFSGNVHPVAGKQANAFGLYDMSGNVWEWVEDCWNKSYIGAPSDGSAWTSGKCDVRMLRGGSSYSKSAFVRSAFRDRDYTAGRLSGTGFRLARMLP